MKDSVQSYTLGITILQYNIQPTAPYFIIDQQIARILCYTVKFFPFYATQIINP